MSRTAKVFTNRTLRVPPGIPLTIRAVTMLESSNTLEGNKAPRKRYSQEAMLSGGNSGITMDLMRLRRQTSGEHATTEDTVPLMSPSLTRAEYTAMLRRFYRVVSAWDRWVDGHTPQDLLPLLTGRRRATLLRRDLEVMGETRPADPDDAAPSRMEKSVVEGNPRSIFLGRMYVMEGSTLGGQYIARHVEETLGLKEGEGNAYFRGYGEATGERWREFRAVLQALPETEADTVIASAKEMFAIFGDAMRDPTSGHLTPSAYTTAGEVTADRLL